MKIKQPRSEPSTETRALRLPSGDQLDAVPRRVFSFTVQRDFAGETEAHRHDCAQLLYVLKGAVTMRAAGGIWTVPPQCALWMPSGVLHYGSVAGPARTLNLYLERSLATSIYDKCGILFVQPLLRELLFRFDANEPFQARDPEHENSLIDVLLHELRAAPLEPLHLPMPSDKRLLRLTEAMLDNPAARHTADEWGARVGASNRTLSRLFQRETGMSLTRWRQQLHVGLALQRLAEGELVTNIALDLGYENASAFIAMFRRMLGTTPARYFTSGTHSEHIDRQKLMANADRAISLSDYDGSANVLHFRAGPRTSK
jgi:AraC-like DNA-binding protein